ncbi:MAG TPA: hypothetical protein VJ910_06915 [Desulfuromonadales bacterium]|nr:hypothetical protein [Desulfuromonadales bacterium]
MNGSLVLGCFALYVVGVSLFGILSGTSDDCLARVRRSCGRVRGLALYFCLQVAMPMLIGIVFLSWGIADFNLSAASSPKHSTPGAAVFKIDWQAIQQIREAAEEAAPPEVYLPIPLCA